MQTQLAARGLVIQLTIAHWPSSLRRRRMPVIM